MPQIITGLDIGTHSIKAMVAESRGGKPLPTAVIEESSSGMRKGAIVEMAEAVHSLARVFSKMRDVSKSSIKNIYLNIGTAQARVQHSKGVTAVSRADTEIYQDDVDRAIRASQAINFGSNRMIVHTITKEFIVDGVGDIADPIGLGGSRLEVSTLVVDAFEPHIKALIKAVQLNGGLIKGLTFDPLAASQAALTKNQKDLGTVLVDIGFGTTGMAVYEENKLLGTAVFPVGAGNITNDIAIGFKIPVAIAEQLKLNYGYAVSKDVGSKETVDLKKIYPEGKGFLSRRLLAEIIEARLVEIFEFVNGELKLLSKSGQLAGGVVLVGGGSKLPGIAELAAEELRLTSMIGMMSSRENWADEAQSGPFSEYFDDPSYVSAFGLVMWGANEEKWQKAGKAVLNLSNLLKYFLP